MPPLTEPKRLRILRAVKARLERIQQVAGYHTNAGDHVALGHYRIPSGVPPAGELPALVVKFGRTITHEASRGFAPPGLGVQGKRTHIDLPLIVEALVLDDQDDALAQAELAVSDIKRALWGGNDDESLGGLIHAIEPGEVEPVAREEGSQFSGMQVEMLLKMSEKRGEPEN